MEEAIELEYQVKLEDYLDGNQAIIQYNHRKKWISWLTIEVFAVVTIAFGIFYVFLGILELNSLSISWLNHLLLDWLEIDRSYNFSTIDRITIIFLGCFCSMLGIFLGLMARPKFNSKLYSIGWKKFWQKYPIQGEARKLKVSEFNLTIKSQTLNINCQWSSLTRFIEGELVFVLFWFTGETKILPKRMFTSETQLNEFRELLDRNINKHQ
jgi:hypothetical protein